MLRTSINMSYAVFEKIALAAARRGICRRELVIMLLRRVLRDIDRFQGGFTLVRYQPRDPLKQWKHFPICFRKNENEFSQDFRKLSRFSLSYLVAIATRRYLDELLRERDAMCNYSQFPQYAIGRRTIKHVTCWEFYWGNTENLPKRASPARILRRTTAQ
ncbi:MAG: hypothetical protein EPN93_05735 [Spirochaetes bacterium]|nr:MAG: hypothetical protein EPN93_05735 [Spirochaetota bacterium]